jgi:hypothetical protein
MVMGVSAKDHGPIDFISNSRIESPKDMTKLEAYLLSDTGAWITVEIIHFDGKMSSLRVSVAGSMTLNNQ